MPPRRSGNVQPPFPFPCFASLVDEARRSDAEPATSPVTPILQQLLSEAERWLREPDHRPAVGPAPDVSQLPVGLSGLVGKAFDLLREVRPGEQASAGEPHYDKIGLLVGSVADWIDRTGYFPRAAALFYQLTVAYFPGRLALATRLGRALRTIAMYDEAEAWLHHAAAALQRSSAPEDGEFAVTSLSALGNLKRERGNFPEARRSHREALDAARELGLRKLEGDALYDLAVMAFEHSDIASGISYAREAITAYGPGHSQLRRLANDLAWVWMHFHGEGFRALQLFIAIEPHVHAPGFRGVLLANIARATAQIDTDELFEATWLDAYTFLARQHDERGKAAALGQLALASLLAEQLERTREVAGQCREIAARRGEHRMVFLADQILDAIAGGMPEREDFDALFPGLLAEREPQVEEREEEDFAYDLGDAAAGARRDGAPESPVRALVRGR